MIKEELLKFTSIDAINYCQVNRPNRKLMINNKIIVTLLVKITILFS